MHVAVLTLTKFNKIMSSNSRVYLHVISAYRHASLCPVLAQSSGHRDTRIYSRIYTTVSSGLSHNQEVSDIYIISDTLMLCVWHLYSIGAIISYVLLVTLLFVGDT